MKTLVYVAVAVLSFVSQTISAGAVTHVAIAGASHGCTAPASVDGTPYWRMPTIAEDEGASGIAQVKIDLTAAGDLAGATIFSSSGNPVLDQAALESARMTRFTSEVANCKHVGGSYLYQVEF
ncbi:MAG TPA: TonB family protein [Candidatus Baltobacteraceae bacterium]|nr:TonB family protein [Candidatus Baltobacteraceae bacterium]